MRNSVIIRNLALIGALALPLGLALCSGYSAFIGTSFAKPATVSWILVVFGLAFVALNAFISFVRPTLYARRNSGSLEGYRNVSVFPIVGSILATIAVLFAWGHIFVTSACLLILLADTGGVVWILVALSRDASFWSEQSVV